MAGVRVDATSTIGSFLCHHYLLLLYYCRFWGTIKRELGVIGKYGRVIGKYGIPDRNL